MGEFLNEAKGEVILEESGNIAIFIIKGVLEIMQSLILEEKVEAYLRRPKPRLVFDLQGVTHLSSSGIRVFISTLRQINSVGGKLILCNLSPVVVRILETVELLDVARNKEEAIKRLS